MNSPDNRSPINTNKTNPQAKRPIAMMSWIVLLIGLSAIVFAIYSVQNITKEAPIETITREGVVTQIQNLNRLETVSFSVDTVVTSQRGGSWQKLWQDEQKGLFIVHGRVEAGVDLSALTPDMVRVTQPIVSDVDSDQASEANTTASTMPQINITLPQSEIFSVYLDDIEIYDWQTGAFGMMQVDPKIFDQAQSMAKKEVLERACRGDVMTMALQNAQTQLQQLFALTGAVVTVTTQGAGACQFPSVTNG